MKISESTKTETRRVIEVNGVRFYVEDLVNPLGWLRHGSIEDELVDSSTLRKMREAELVTKTGGSNDMTTMGREKTPVKWRQVDGKCKELFDQLNEPYSKWRVKCGRQTWGPWDESETRSAKQQAKNKKRELEERNPDMEFRLHEEELNHIPTG